MRTHSRRLVAAAFFASLLLPPLGSASQPRRLPVVGSVAWAPGSKQLAVVWDRPEGRYVLQGIHLMRPNGSHRVDLTPKAPGAYDAAWSPNGKRIAFDVPGTDRGGDGNLEVMSADGSGVRLLAKNVDEPAWSPDGRLIVSWTFGVRDNLELLTPNGRLVRKLTFRFLALRFPFWSSDGRWIEFYANGGAGPIYAIRPNGKDLHVVRRRFADSSDSWSSDGNVVAYVSSGALYLKESGKRPVRLLPRKAAVGRVFISPDGKWIAVIEHSTKLFLIRPNGRGLHRLLPP